MMQAKQADVKIHGEKAINVTQPPAPPHPPHTHFPHEHARLSNVSGGQQARGKGVWLGAAPVHWLFSSEGKVRGYGVTGHPLKGIINTPAVLSAASSFTRCAQNGGKCGNPHVILQPQARYNRLMKTCVISCFRNPPISLQCLTEP